MQEPNRPDPKIVQKYIDDAMKRLDENPDSLEKFERRLLSKIRKSSVSAQQSFKDLQDLRNQITQAEARLRSVELQAESYQGQVSAYIDEIVSLKFDLDEPLPPPAPTPDPAGNGAPKAVNRKQRRAAKSKAVDKQEASANN